MATRYSTPKKNVHTTRYKIGLSSIPLYVSQTLATSDNDRHEEDQRRRNQQHDPTPAPTQFPSHSGAVGDLTEDEMLALAIQQSTAGLTEDEMIQLALAASTQM